MRPIKLLILEDDPIDCSNFLDALKDRKDFELIAVTDSDIEAMQLVKSKRPEALVVDIELNNNTNGNADSFAFLSELKSLDYRPIIIITTYINSNRTYQILHRNGVDLILYKNHPKYSASHVLNKFIALREPQLPDNTLDNLKVSLASRDDKISKLINHELDLIGISQKLIGRKYIYDGLYQVLTTNNFTLNITAYICNLHKKSSTTVNNGISTAINCAWRLSAVEDLLIHYTAKVNYETGIPTPMEFMYYYIEKIRKLI